MGGEALNALRSRISGKAAPAEPTPPKSPATPASESPDPPAKAQDGKPPETPAAAVPDAKPAKPPGPWQLKEKYEKLSRQLESENLELKARLAKAADAEAAAKRAEAAEKRLAELESDMRFIDYSRSSEYQQKYARPYQDAYGRALSDFKQLQVQDGEGNQRPATEQDLLALASAPVGQLDELAETWFGKSAPRVVRHIEKMRELADDANRALETARKDGETHRQQQETATRQIHEAVAQNWQVAIAEVPDFLKPKEGDDEWNGRVDKAREWVDETLKANVADPKLTAEQRAEAIRRHANMRWRAIGYSSLKLELKRAQSEAAALRKELEAFKKSGPPEGEGNGRPPTSAALNTLAGSTAALRARLEKAGGR